MKNTGTWNGDFAIVLVLFMLLPLFIYFLIEIIKCFDQSYEHYYTSEPITIETTIETTIEPEVDFESIKRMALIQAAQGNNAARNWVTKHVFNEQQDKAKSATLLTSQKIVDDTMAALTAVKYKKADAKAVVYRLGAQKKYIDVGSMVLDCIKEL
jgi:hypothetical protein